MGCIYRGDRWRDLQPPFTHHHKEMIARGIIKQRHRLAPIDHAAANHAIDKGPTSLINRVIEQRPSSLLGVVSSGVLPSRVTRTITQRTGRDTVSIELPLIFRSANGIAGVANGGDRAVNAGWFCSPWRQTSSPMMPSLAYGASSRCLLSRRKMHTGHPQWHWTGCNSPT